MNGTSTATAADPNVVLPAAVRSAARLSEELISRSTAAPEALPSADSGAPTPPSAPSPPPPPDPALTPPPPETSAKPQKDLDPDVQQRIRSAEGRASAADRRARELEETNANLRATMAAMHTIAPSPAQSQSSELSLDHLITPQEREAYGDEFLDVVGKRTKQVYGKEIEDLKNTVKDLTGRLQGVGQHMVMNARDQMFSTLDRQVPHWRELNTNDAFNAWLSLTDPYSGATRKMLLDAAVAQNDTSRVAAFFTGFLSEEAALDPTRGREPGTQPSVTLKDLAAPGRARSAATTPPAEKPIIARSDIQKFYADVAKGLYRGKEAEQKTHEETIFAAQRDGRIR